MVKRGNAGKKGRKKETNHACIFSIPTLHRPAHFKAHAFVDLHVRFVLRALKVTFYSLAISLLRNRLEQKSSHALALCLGTNSHDIAEVVPARIIPDLCLGCLLLLFPNPVPVCAESTVA